MYMIYTDQCVYYGDDVTYELLEDTVLVVRYIMNMFYIFIKYLGENAYDEKN